LIIWKYLCSWNYLKPGKISKG